MSLLSVGTTAAPFNVLVSNNTEVSGKKAIKPVFGAVKERKRTALGTITNVQRRNPDRACKGKANGTVYIAQPTKQNTRKGGVPQPFDVYVDPPKTSANEVEFQDHVRHLVGDGCNKKARQADSPMVISPFESKKNGGLRSSPPCNQDGAEYEDDILKYLKVICKERRPRVGYMNKQPNINYYMRSILVDWLIEVGEEFSLDNRTVCLAVAYIDQFLSVMSVQRSKLQLVGTASLFIAAKFEEIYPPDAQDFVYVTDDTYSHEQLLKMEQLILETIEYNVSIPTVIDFLGILFDATGFHREEREKLRCLAMYLCELTLLDSRTFHKYLPVNIAASAILLASHTLKLPVFSDSLMQKSSSNVTDLMACMDDLQDAFKEAPSLKYKAVIEKYSEKYMNVAGVDPILQTFDYLF